MRMKKYVVHAAKNSASAYGRASAAAQTTVAVTIANTGAGTPRRPRLAGRVAQRNAMHPIAASADRVRIQCTLGEPRRSQRLRRTK